MCRVTAIKTLFTSGPNSKNNRNFTTKLTIGITTKYYKLTVADAVQDHQTLVSILQHRIRCVRLLERTAECAGSTDVLAEKCCMAGAGYRL